MHRPRQSVKKSADTRGRHLAVTHVTRFEWVTDSIHLNVLTGDGRKFQFTSDLDPTLSLSPRNSPRAPAFRFESLKPAAPRFIYGPVMSFPPNALFDTDSRRIVVTNFDASPPRDKLLPDRRFFNIFFFFFFFSHLRICARNVEFDR